jgi:hypothetical protein
VAVVIGFLASGGDLGDLPVVAWLIVALVAVVPLAVVGAIFWARRRGAGWVQPALIAGVDKPRRKEIVAAIRTNRPVREEDQQIASDLARRRVGQRWIVWYLPGFAVFIVVTQFLSDDFGTGDVLALISAGMMLCVAPFTLRDVRRARRWLADHGDATAP